MQEYARIVLSVTGFGLQHSGLSALRIKAQIIRRFGQMGYSVLYLTTSVIVLYITFWTLNFSDWWYFLTPATQLNWLLFLPGVFLVGIGVLIAIGGIRVLGINAIADMNPDRFAELEIRGIYAQIRHPRYILHFGDRRKALSKPVSPRSPRF